MAKKKEPMFYKGVEIKEQKKFNARLNKFVLTYVSVYGEDTNLDKAIELIRTSLMSKFKIQSNIGELIVIYETNENRFDGEVCFEGTNELTNEVENIAIFEFNYFLSRRKDKWLDYIGGLDYIAFDELKEVCNVWEIVKGELDNKFKK